eukprot:520347-Prymnesium_polylepis.1
MQPTAPSASRSRALRVAAAPFSPQGAPRPATPTKSERFTMQPSAPRIRSSARKPTAAACRVSIRSSGSSGSRKTPSTTQPRSSTSRTTRTMKGSFSHSSTRSNSTRTTTGLASPMAWRSIAGIAPSTAAGCQIGGTKTQTEATRAVVSLPHDSDAFGGG